MTGEIQTDAEIRKTRTEVRTLAYRSGRLCLGWCLSAIDSRTGCGLVAIPAHSEKALIRPSLNVIFISAVVSLRFGGILNAREKGKILSGPNHTRIRSQRSNRRKSRK